MTIYTLPQIPPTPAVEPNVVWTVASGDLRLSANVTCWPVQQQLEENLGKAMASQL